MTDTVELALTLGGMSGHHDQSETQLQYLNMHDATVHCTKGIGIWQWASTDEGIDPDVVLGCAGDVPTMETLAAVQILREWFPDLRMRVVNVVDVMRLQDDRAHPHGLSGKDFGSLFTASTTGHCGALPGAAPEQADRASAVRADPR